MSTSVEAAVQGTPSRAAWGNRVLAATAMAQLAIVVTGGVVRITDSGLGCPTWPRCTDASIGPVGAGLTMWIEFSNRLVAAGVIALCVASLVVVARRRDRPSVAWAAAQLAGVISQAIVGGVAVMASLDPIVVALHMLVSAFLIYAAVTIKMRFDPPLAGFRPTSRVRHLATATCAIGLVVVVAGTAVAAAGPYAGDATAARLSVNLVVATRLHALAAMILLGFLLATTRATRTHTMSRSGGPPGSGPNALLIAALGLLVAQLGVGVWQVSSGRPALGVVVHLLLAAILVAVLSCLHRCLRPLPQEASLR